MDLKYWFPVILLCGDKEATKWYERHEALREISFFRKRQLYSLTVIIQKHMTLEMLRLTNQI